MPVALIATTAFRYDGRLVATGARFTARSRDDARILKLIGRATDVPAPKVLTRASVAETPEDETIVTDDAPVVEDAPKRRYRRRDLTADPA